MTYQTITKLCAECADKQSTADKAMAKARRKSEIIAELSALDAKSIRPLRAKVSGIATAEDETILSDINTKIVALRAELATLK